MYYFMVTILVSVWKLQIEKEETGCNTMIIIKSKCSDDDTDKTDESSPNDDHTEHLLRIITTCLNKPLQEMLERWLANLKTVGSTKEATGIKAEIEAIRKQMEFEDYDKSAAVSVLPIVSSKFIVPDDVKHYLFR